MADEMWGCRGGQAQGRGRLQGPGRHAAERPARRPHCLPVRMPRPTSCRRFGSLNTVVVREARPAQSPVANAMSGGCPSANAAGGCLPPAACRTLCQPVPRPARSINLADASSASAASLASLEPGSGMEADSGCAAAAAPAALPTASPMQQGVAEVCGGSAADLVGLELDGFVVDAVVPGETIGQVVGQTQQPWSLRAVLRCKELRCAAAAPATADRQPIPAPGPALQVLSRANHDAGQMLGAVGAATASAVARGDMAPEVAARLTSAYAARMSGYTCVLGVGCCAVQGPGAAAECGRR